LSIHKHDFTFKHLCWHSITKILRNGPRAHFPFIANLNMQQKEKLNELIGSIHEKDELLDS
jgi:hypothetical protein